MAARRLVVVRRPPGLKNKGQTVDEQLSCWGLMIVIVDHERGIPSKRNSSNCVDYVPAFCTHRPSLLPMNSAVNYSQAVLKERVQV